MFSVLDRYIATHVAIATLIVVMTLTGVVLMTQSLRFLELIIESGASGLAFITLSLLALPRFFEVILPVSCAAATLFVLTRMRKDGEILALQAAGATPARLIKPGLLLSVLLGFVLFIMMGVIAPKTLATMHQMRQLIKSQYAHVLFRDGIFNSIGNDITVYVAERDGMGYLKGLMIYDARPQNKYPVTILAQSGQLVMNDHEQKVVVQKGERQVFNLENNTTERLQFDQYVIDLPGNGPLEKRWAEPEERSFISLLYPAASDEEAHEKYAEFRAELHRRIMAPFLVPCFFLIAALIVILSPYSRSGRPYELMISGGSMVILLAAYIASFSYAKENLIGILLMYGITLVPFGGGLWIMWRFSKPLFNTTGMLQVPCDQGDPV